MGAALAANGPQKRRRSERLAERGRYAREEKACDLLLRRAQGLADLCVSWVSGFSRVTQHSRVFN